MKNKILNITNGDAFNEHLLSKLGGEAVRDNSDKDDMAIICILLEMSKEYGLSDVQAQELVKSIRSLTERETDLWISKLNQR